MRQPRIKGQGQSFHHWNMLLSFTQAALQMCLLSQHCCSPAEWCSSLNLNAPDREILLSLGTG